MSEGRSDQGWPLRVKICGITRVEDAVVAAHAGADYLGTILSSGFGRSVPLENAVAYGAETGVPVIGVTVDETLEDLVRIGREAELSVLQLHGTESAELVGAVGAEGPWQVWKALRVRTAEEIEEAIATYAPVADGLLLDGWHPEHRGGSGVRFPWDLLSPLRGRFPDGLSFIAAGGLTAENVGDAIRHMRPDVVDVSSGVEITHGIKEPGRVRSFVRGARSAARQLSREQT
ncbi:MAG TPA: phosphoribosylanthranilate isomerase [Longimicrobiales bacterium]|nr:phosphoribosylanthranilate isomerase [Longimicrobiales bacterium]